MIDEEYFGCDEGNEFHQKEDSTKDKMQKKIGDALILLDSQSTHKPFFVRRLEKNIRDAV
jgi:hypothetical protein